MPSGYTLPRKRCKIHGSYRGSEPRCLKCFPPRRRNPASKLARGLTDDELLALLSPLTPGAALTYESATEIWGITCKSAMGRVNTLVHYGWIEAMGQGQFRVREERKL